MAQELVNPDDRFPQPASAELFDDDNILDEALETLRENLTEEDANLTEE